MITPAPQSQQRSRLDEQIESCQQRILGLIDTVEQGGGEAVVNGSDTAGKIAYYYARMGDLFLEGGDKTKAAACYESALQLNPRQWAARMNLLKTKSFVTEDDNAKAFLQGMLAEQRHNASLLNQLGKLHYKLYECNLALDCFLRALEIEPENADSLYWLAGIQQGIGDYEAARENYVRAAKIRPLIKIHAEKAVPDFCALLIFAPFAGNTPTEYLMAGQPYEVNVFPMLPQLEPDAGLLKHSGHVVINFVSDADQGRAVLPQVEKLVDRLGLPVINHPAKVRKTTRESIAYLLQDMPGCRFARILRHEAGEEATVGALRKKIPFSVPLLARPAGTHGGDRFEKIASLEALAEFIRQEPDADHYIMEYVDYQSADGHFRKYRFIFIDGEILPYHLAIGNHWKVHHISTDMSRNAWMQDEERAFLENPTTVFASKHYQALHAIHVAVGLDYFGIDCGLDREGNLVVFEVNASMLVHQKNEGFPYKAPFVEKIKRAFDNMLEKRARGV